ncbi:hypothetical protein [Bacillus thermotolerans]|uniref:Uncharacterized protein n=1 Tax=Bacillus thermotolerans TaxID=1221996 RepID=A0A0F5I902_BACTR|nr:hypothetical protein [Bacillus thermotolerans]KKB41780.1 hypothetical protein QY95_00587 [Bacillus thermotolerans]KKB44327.1 hypothetical protein QY96_02927 [Bacillus thermotolerans]
MDVKDPRMKILTAVKYVGATILAIGTLIFLVGFFGSVSMPLTPIGIGTVVGAVFIFIMGAFFVSTEEMLEKIYEMK